MRVLVAPDKFRGSLTAGQAAAAIEAGIRRVRPDVDVRSLPVADGGDGTVEVAVRAGFTARTVTVAGPTGEPVDARYALRGGTAVIEMAESSGLRRLARAPDRRTAATASSYGAGQLIVAALDAGARRIVLGAGGSASTDGGTGLAHALGVGFLDRAGQPVVAGGAGLRALRSIDRRGLDRRLESVELIIATDVDNPLVGPQGAAHVYAPQKGADPATVDLLDAGLRNLAAVIAHTTGRDVSAVAGTGAAGGIAASALPLLGAVLGSGIDIVLQLIGFPAAVVGAALVITGEGSLDDQSLHGKAVHGVASMSVLYGVPVVAVAGRVQVNEHELAQAGIRRAYSLAEVEDDASRRMSHAEQLVSLVSERVARDWLPERDTR